MQIAQPPSQTAEAALLKRLAKQLIWWETSDAALQRPEAVILQAMDIGTIEDMFEMEEVLGRERLRHCLQNAQAGQLRPRSWYFWHYRLGVTPPDQEPPPMPARRFS